MVLNKANVLIQVKQMKLFRIELSMDYHHLEHIQTKFLNHFSIKKTLPNDICVSSLFEWSDDVLHFDILNDCCGRNTRDVDHMGDDVLQKRELIWEYSI